MTTPKAYKGIGMNGVIAKWYAKNTARDTGRFEAVARIVTEQAGPGRSVLEVAPGPGYLAVEIAKAGRQVSAIDISETFVEMVRENAARAGVYIDARQGDAAHMPFADASFDYVVCVAAFKNFADPVGALNEIHRVLKPGGGASIFDLKKDADTADIDSEVEKMNLSRWNAWVTRWTFRSMLLKRAYTGTEIEQMATASRFGRCQVFNQGIGFEMRLEKKRATRNLAFACL